MQNIKSIIATKLTDPQCNFEFHNIPTALANSIRRIMLSEIPCIAFENEPENVFSFLNDINVPIPKSIHIIKNTSSLDNEYLSHRISLIPLRFNYQIKSYFDNTLNSRRYFIDNDKLPTFILNLTNNKETIEKLTNGTYFTDNKQDYDSKVTINQNIINVTTNMFLLKDPKEGESTLDYIDDPTTAQSKVLGNEKSYILLNKLKHKIIQLKW